MPSILQTLRMWRDPVGFQTAAQARFGEPFVQRFHPVGELVVVSDAGTARAIFMGDPETFRAGEANGKILPILGCGSLLLADGVHHRRRRHVLTPAFHGTRVTDLGDQIVCQTREAMARWPADRAFRLLPSLQTITLNVILRAVIDTATPGAQAELARRARLMLAPAAGAALLLGRGHRAWWSLGGIFGRREAAVHALVREELARRRRDQSQPTRPDALGSLMAASDDEGRPLDDGDICDEVVTLLIAGHETTSVALAWAFERVLRHATVLDRVREGVAAGRDDVYLDAVVKETLRSRPPLIDAVRTLGHPLTIGGCDLTAGSTVMVSIPLVHHRPELYPDPHRFLPDRFLAGRPGPYDWIPFGGGARRCIGAELASFEVSTVLSTVLAGADLRAERVEPEQTRLLGTALIPARGGSVTLRRRLR